MTADQPVLFEEASASGIRKSAQISPCGRYRYSLTRTWDDGGGDSDGELRRKRNGHVLWIMLNPSTADANEDDPTIRRCMAFTRAWGCGGMAVANLFALRSTAPTALTTGYEESVGPDNDRHLRRLVADYSERADYIVAAWGGWGSHRLLVARRNAVLRLLPVAETLCLGTTRSGDPGHPLYLPGSRTPDHYEFPALA